MARKGPKFYAVRVGRKPGVYDTWDETEKLVAGFRGAVRKLINSDAAFDDDSYQKSRPDPTPPAPAAASTPSPAPPPAKRAKLNPAPAVQQAPTTTSKNSNNDIAVVYTDGAAPGNGKAHAQAGIGVWFGANDPRNISARLPGPVQTNQRAELTAILYALEAFPLTTSVEIRTDSQYSIDCVTRWYLGWVENGWRSSKGEPVKNDDIIKPIRARIDSRDAAGASTRFTKVAGHSGEPGNDQADLLAVAGAQLPAVS
ncbi:ribonuclease H-like domain-containing protein [Apiosordaria backusii]|uniref:Ribonuclease H n=1 Tax=Apiosordaria backusii TaxID=314023 RepID=A0AA40DPC6_9PEZI|nr:ribonuclease H-like domain-containing protein [Apiosordaria backusii]